MVKIIANAKQSPMQKQFAATCEDKRKSMFLYVARELTGWSMQRKLNVTAIMVMERNNLRSLSLLNNQ